MLGRAFVLTRRQDNPPYALLRLDAGPTVGHGHAARCATLAHGLRAKGWQTDFSINKAALGTPTLAAFTEHAIVVENTTVDANHATALQRQLQRDYDLLVVDHYGLDQHFERAARDFADRILVIDDLANRPHDCDWLLDQGGIHGAEDYALNANCETLMGPCYALLGSDYAMLRDRHKPWLRDRSLESVGVCLGATDPDNITLRVLEALAMTNRDLNIGVFTTSANPNLAALKAYNPRNTTNPPALYVDHPNLPNAILDADLIIGAGGVSVWERCALGTPSIVIPTAANQHANLAKLRHHGCAAVIQKEMLPDGLVHLMQHITDTELNRQSTAAAQLCDGRGVNRVLTQTVCAGTAVNGKRVYLRPANDDDTDRLLAWQSAPGTRAFARNRQIPSEEEHRAWMSRTLSDPDHVMCIIMYGNTSAGVLRLDSAPAPNGALAREISILVDPDHQRLGLARIALTLGHELMPHAMLLGEVLPANYASHNLFQRTGFSFDGRVYIKEPLS